MRLLNSQSELMARVGQVRSNLERFIREKKPAISKAVRAPFGQEPSRGSAGQSWQDSSWGDPSYPEPRREE